MNTFFRRLSVVFCLGILFLSSLGFSQSWKEEGAEEINPTTTNNQTTNQGTNANGQQTAQNSNAVTNSTDTNATEEGIEQNEDSANRFKISDEEARKAKREAVQQDFDGIIPSPGIEQLDRDGNKIGDIGEKIKNGTVELTDIIVIIIKLMDLATKLAGTIAVVFIMYGGFQYILSGFTDEKENAKNTLKYAISGLIVCFLAWLIITVVKTQMTQSADQYEAQMRETTTQDLTLD